VPAVPALRYTALSRTLFDPVPLKLRHKWACAAERNRKDGVDGPNGIDVPKCGVFRTSNKGAARHEH
jgi:hypothetical protein